MKKFITLRSLFFIVGYLLVLDINAQIGIFKLDIETVRRGHFNCDSAKVKASIVLNNQQLTPSDSIEISLLFSNSTSKVDTVISQGIPGDFTVKFVFMETFFPQNGTYSTDYIIKRLNDGYVITGSFQQQIAISHPNCVKHEVIVGNDLNNNCQIDQVEFSKKLIVRSYSKKNNWVFNGLYKRDPFQNGVYYHYYNSGDSIYANVDLFSQEIGLNFANACFNTSASTQVSKIVQHVRDSLSIHRIGKYFGNIHLKVDDSFTDLEFCKQSNNISLSTDSALFTFFGNDSIKFFYQINNNYHLFFETKTVEDEGFFLPNLKLPQQYLSDTINVGLIAVINSNDTVVFSIKNQFIPVICDSVIIFSFADVNGNCQYDANETSLSGIGIDFFYSIVSQSQGFRKNYEFNTNSNGFKKVYVFPNSNNFLFYLIRNNAENCFPDGFLAFNQLPDTVYIPIDCQPNGNNRDLKVALNWSGMRRPGEELRLIPGIASNVSHNERGIATLTLDPRVHYLGQTDPNLLTPILVGNMLIWQYQNLPNGCDVMNYFAGSLRFLLDTSLTMLDTICFTFAILPKPLDSNLANNKTKLCISIAAAYDPNIKVVSPLGDGEMGAVMPGTHFAYTVFFQNTGNSYAKNVRILDYLPNTLNINKLQVVDGSHSFTYNVYGDVIEFIFNNIYLPDSNTNEPESHGWVTYNIPHQLGLPLGTQIRSWADIYFDYNLPIRTDTTINTLELTTSQLPIQLSKQNLKMFPNPAKDQLNLLWDEPYTGVVKVYDLAGKLVISQSIKSTIFQNIATSHLPNGMYLLQTQNEKELKRIKLIVQN